MTLPDPIGQQVAKWNEPVTPGILSQEGIYQRAWELLLERLDSGTQGGKWSKAELRKLMLQCLVEAGKP